MKNIIKFAVVFIISFVCFNHGMNEIFVNYTITLTSICMVVVPVLTIGLFILYEVFKELYIDITKEKPERDA